MNRGGFEGVQSQAASAVAQQQLRAGGRLRAQQLQYDTGDYRIDAPRPDQGPACDGCGTGR
jgi:hypothetical protein